MSLHEIAALGVAIAALGSAGCDDDEPADRSAPAASARPDPPAASAASAAKSGTAALGAASASATPLGGPSASEGDEREEDCPGSMARVPGGETWIGSPAGQGAEDEHPRYKTRLAPFCLDRTEVTVAAYAECVEAGACTAAQSGRVTCTASGGDRPKHPVNCVTWTQADAYCRHVGGRLPTEAEWEYAASGGDDRPYSWGDAPPDGRTCWKKAGACPVGSYEAGAFGLFDMTGNVWEWTADWYGDYPWPPEKAHHKVYRGGSWSRRFVKWMRVRLRNRWAPDHRGSHLGFRCAKTLPSAECPFGKTDAGECAHGVLEAECEGRRAWNGVRCASPGAPKCPAGFEPTEHHGCVLAVAPKGDSNRREEYTGPPVRRTRAPAFDEDCRTYQPSRPKAYRFEGGTHLRRNAKGRELGCKNRDVGVGWNSACCP